jgi:hypothetical protein
VLAQRESQPGLPRLRPAESAAPELPECVSAGAGSEGTVFGIDRSYLHRCGAIHRPNKIITSIEV